jgi:hypothetical protein
MDQQQANSPKMTPLVKLLVGLASVMTCVPLAVAFGFNKPWLQAVGGFSVLALLLSAIAAWIMAAWRLLTYLRRFALFLVGLPAVFALVAVVASNIGDGTWGERLVPAAPLLVVYVVLAFLLGVITKDLNAIKYVASGPRAIYAGERLVCDKCESEIVIQDKTIERGSLLEQWSRSGETLMNQNAMECLCPKCGLIDERRLPLKVLLKLSAFRLIGVSVAFIIMVIIAAIISSVSKR